MKELPAGKKWEITVGDLRRSIEAADLADHCPVLLDGCEYGIRELHGVAPETVGWVAIRDFIAFRNPCSRASEIDGEIRALVFREDRD